MRRCTDRCDGKRGPYKGARDIVREYLAMDKFRTLISSGLADLWVTVIEVGDADTSSKVQRSAAVLELSPRSLGRNHNRVTCDPAEPLCNMLNTDVL